MICTKSLPSSHLQSRSLTKLGINTSQGLSCYSFPGSAELGAAGVCCVWRVLAGRDGGDPCSVCVQCIAVIPKRFFAQQHGLTRAPLCFATFWRAGFAWERASIPWETMIHRNRRSRPPQGRPFLKDTFLGCWGEHRSPAHQEHHQGISFMAGVAL